MLQGGKARAADPADEESRLPTELHQDTYGQEPGNAYAFAWLLLSEIVDDQGQVARKQQQSSSPANKIRKPISSQIYAGTNCLRAMISVIVFSMIMSTPSTIFCHLNRYEV